MYGAAGTWDLAGGPAEPLVTAAAAIQSSRIDLENACRA